jgi:dephospho-CoA kinase
MIVIGLTGGVGTGKSTVARMFQQRGAIVLDADALARQALEPKRLAWRETVRAFGPGILNDDETVNRRRLAEVVFSDEQARRRLERILHPRVLRQIKEQLRRLRRAKPRGVVVLDVPLLFEAGAQGMADVVVVVTAPPEAQRKRLRDKFRWTEEETAARAGAQWELSAKEALADHIIDNAGGVEETRTQVKRIWEQLGPQARASRSSSTSRR